MIHDMRFQNLNRRERFVAASGTKIQLSRNNLKFNRVPVALWIVPVRQRVETIVDHHQGVMQVFLTFFAAR